MNFRERGSFASNLYAVSALVRQVTCVTQWCALTTTPIPQDTQISVLEAEYYGLYAYHYNYLSSLDPHAMAIVANNAGGACVCATGCGGGAWVKASTYVEHNFCVSRRYSGRHSGCTLVRPWCSGEAVLGSCFCMFSLVGRHACVRVRSCSRCRTQLDAGAALPNLMVFYVEKLDWRAAAQTAEVRCSLVALVVGVSHTLHAPAPARIAG